MRDYALILLTLDTGIRPKEAFSLLIEHFDFKTLQVYIPSDVAKTRVSRVIAYFASYRKCNQKANSRLKFDNNFLLQNSDKTRGLLLFIDRIYEI
ncbi:tyrosine-type recombinase/integrase [Caldicellulosiruptor obsidiansis]|uniref:tyrosine-type recombinase/integrase n=1 Tax=Caldicellulosiruptor obsidiansis TaxID=717609 RepID=UPI001ED92D0F|nr:tyrosine-type recombinase/integrase [Caldicellulosiruptor obsidiansis]